MRSVLLLTAALVIAACKAEKVEISLDSETVLAAAEGRTGEIGFEATLGEKYATVDDEKRALIASVTKLIQQNFPGAEALLHKSPEGIHVVNPA